MSASGSVDILAAIDDDSPLWVDAIRLAGGEETSVTITLPLNGTTISLTFTAGRFHAVVEQLRRFAERLPGKPS